MDVKVEVFGQRLKIPTNQRTFISGSKNFVRFIFEFTSDWDGITTFVQFQQNGYTYNTFLDSNNAVYLPSKIGDGKCELALYGENDGKTVIATANNVSLNIKGNMILINSSAPTITYGYNDPSGGDNGDIYFKIIG